MLDTEQIPNVDEIVRTALLAACEDLYAECAEHQRGLLGRVLSGKTLAELGEHQLRSAYGLLRRAVTTNRAAPVAAPEVSGDYLTYTIELPWDRPPLNHNGRGMPRARARIIKEVRTKVGWLAAQQKIPSHDFLVVRLHYAPGRNGRQDPMNWTATSKPAIDGLVDAGVVADDDTDHVYEPPPEILFPPEPGPRCWLTITPA